MDLRHIHLGNKELFFQKETESVQLYAELTPKGVQMCEAVLWLSTHLHIRENGTGWLEGPFSQNELAFYAKFFIGLGNEATVKHPPELLGYMKQLFTEMMSNYDWT
jgi:predicted DNA-binding transcriptional regulator YafY